MRIEDFVKDLASKGVYLSWSGEKLLCKAEDGALTDSLTRPQVGIPTDHREYTRIMLDLMTLAFWSGATGAPWRSAIVAAVFAFHPLQVDSVAWIAERKNLLCTTFGFAALLAYRRYCDRPGSGRGYQPR